MRHCHLGDTVTGYMAATGPCWSCKRLFTFDPDKVPSIVVEGVKQPLCRSCVDRANALRKENGNPLIHPLPGAYLDGGAP